jgi:hypothetical protein
MKKLVNVICGNSKQLLDLGSPSPWHKLHFISRRNSTLAHRRPITLCPRMTPVFVIMQWLV